MYIRQIRSFTTIVCNLSLVKFQSGLYNYFAENPIFSCNYTILTKNLLLSAIVITVKCENLLFIASFGGAKLLERSRT